MRVLFFAALASFFLMALIYELDHGLARGKITVPEGLQPTSAPKAKP